MADRTFQHWTVFTSFGRPSLVLKTSLLAGSLQHSARAPTTLANTRSSSFSSSSGTSEATRPFWLNLVTFSGLMAHFQTLPVTATSSCLLARTSSFCTSLQSGSRPPDLRTIIRVSWFEAHLKMARAQFSFSFTLSFLKWRTSSSIMPTRSNASLKTFCKLIVM